ncbi:small G protein signaling modulator 1-like isoform X2, partial [Silurus meridionalis]
KVKQIMEEAVTRKFVHEESSHIISFCAVVEACVLHGLKRRAAGFLRSNKLAALFLKVGKIFTPAEDLCKKVQELEQLIENKQIQSQTSQDSIRKQSRNPNLSPQAIKHLWIRTALTEKVLDKIVLYLVENSSKFYEREALLRDPVDGPILASLLELMTLKWTPNQLMNGNMGEFDYEKRWMYLNSITILTDRFMTALLLCRLFALNKNSFFNSVYWDYAMTIRLEEIVYLHCHQQGKIIHKKFTSFKGYKYKLFNILKLFLLSFSSLCRAPLKLLCETMKYQIISRAFYGWLAYCRHLSTVRTHLSALVNPTIIEPDIPYNSKGGLSAEVWKTFLQDSSAYEEAELLRLVYYGGVDPTLRKEVWPFLLGHYHFTMTPEERKEVDEQVRACYEQTMSEWLGCEAIVRQREKEQHAAALAKCASGASADLRQDSTISTDSSQSCSSEKQGNACSQCDSNSSTQVFGSVDEVDPIESEPKPKDEKPQPKIPNGTFPTCTSSPDSGHPSSRNFSVTSGLSDCSPSTEDASTQENGSKIKPEPTAVTSEVNVDLLTNPSLEDKLKQEPAEQSLLALGTGKGDLIKSSTGTLTPEDETTKPPVKEKIENSGAKVVNRTDAVKSINSQMVSKEKSELNVAETVQSTNSEHSDDKVKSSDIKEKSKQIVESSVISEKITKSLKGIRGSEVVVETQENMKFNDDKDKTAKNIALEMQEPLRALTKEGSLEEAKTADTSLSANAKELIKPEIPNAPQKEHSKNETQPPEPLSESEMSNIMQSNSSNSDKLDMKSILNWTYDSKRTTVLMKQMNEPVLESCSSILSLSKQSPDTSDDSPSALEMEEIPGALVYMPSADILANVPVTLGPPLALMMPPEKAAVGMPALELCMEAGQNTSPEATESALSEEEPEMESLFPKPDSLAVGDHKNDVASPVSSIGTTYSQELLDLYTLNLHRIDKDVQRCDRNYWYFTTANLEKLRNIMCSYVWQHLDIGYVQGMCDLLAPLLVILDDEAMAFSCFTELMKRMNQNFPHGGAMDTHFANMRSLIQILDSELFELMQQNGDYTHFYFCYRWFLLDFKREMVYDDVFSVWETIWAARTVSSGHFVLFIALALVELYRDIVLENNMDFTDIIKFFNEMAERHDVPQLLVMARDLVHKVQILIENK